MARLFFDSPLEDIQNARIDNERLHELTLHTVLEQGKALQAVYTQSHSHLAAKLDAILVELQLLRRRG